MKSFSLTIIILFVNLAQANLVSRCGVYEVDAFYLKIKSSIYGNKVKRVFLLNRNSDSQVTFNILNKDITRLIPDTYLGVNFRVKLNFVSECNYHCIGEVVEVMTPLSPFQSMRVFPDNVVNPKPCRSSSGIVADP